MTEADNLVGTGLTISPTEQNAFSGAVATFTDAGYPGNTPPTSQPASTGVMARR